MNGDIFRFFSSNFIKMIIIFSVLVFLIWLIIVSGDLIKIDEYCKFCVPFERAISVLVASCPCAIGLAIPSVTSISLNIALKNNILIKDLQIFDKIKYIKDVVFDKTGTLFTKVE